MEVKTVEKRFTLIKPLPNLIKLTQFELHEPHSCKGNKLYLPKISLLTKTLQSLNWFGRKSNETVKVKI